jgi:hypothetical protein
MKIYHKKLLIIFVALNFKPYDLPYLNCSYGFTAARTSNPAPLLAKNISLIETG